MLRAFAALGFLLAACGSAAAEDAAPSERVRLIIETDAGGDPDDEQSLVRFLLYANEWDIEGLIANRPLARDGENLNPVRTGDGIVRRMIEAYGECHPFLVQHDPRFPTAAELLGRTVGGFDDTDAGVDLIIAAVGRPDPRPVWYSDWGTDQGVAENNLKRALDRVRRERGPEGYAAFKSKLRLSSADKFGDHTDKIDPPFPFWVDTWRPQRDGKRWYWQFSEMTREAGGFDLERDCRTGHGPLGAMYPTNTTHVQKEGDTASFLYLVPTGMNDPRQPGWGSWAGRYGANETFLGKPYFWANQEDRWNGTVSRDNTLARWAAALQNDFRARLDWCVRPRNEANHPPEVQLSGIRQRRAAPGEVVEFDASASTDPDGDRLTFLWEPYPEASGTMLPYALEGADGPRARLTVPETKEPADLHVVLTVTDGGDPPLSRYARAIVHVEP